MEFQTSSTRAAELVRGNALVVLDTVTPRDFKSEIRVLATWEKPVTDEQPTCKIDYNHPLELEINTRRDNHLQVIQF